MTKVPTKSPVNLLRNNLFFWLLFFATIISGCAQVDKTVLRNSSYLDQEVGYANSTPFVDSARKQIGVVTRYDTGYYQGAYPPSGSGACTDVIEVALRENGYDLKAKIDQDMEKYPERYPQPSDPNINFRHVVNVKTFLDRNAEKLSTCTTGDCFKQSLWQPGDIVTFDQIPGSLWHIAIVSNKTKRDAKNAAVKIQFLIHNYGRGVVEDDYLLDWPAPISGHYRIKEVSY
ncbi:MAG: DUF1287 domain-containing protein [Patescibacteria group bacterium]